MTVRRWRVRHPRSGIVVHRMTFQGFTGRKDNIPDCPDLPGAEHPGIRNAATASPVALTVTVTARFDGDIRRLMFFDEETCRRHRLAESARPAAGRFKDHVSRVSAGAIAVVHGTTPSIRGGLVSAAESSETLRRCQVENYSPADLPGMRGPLM